MIVKKKVVILWVLVCACLCLFGCAAEPSPSLPTATLVPAQSIPTNTPTSLPPATVTPYPTITPQVPGAVVTDGIQQTGEDSAPTPPEPPTSTPAVSEVGQSDTPAGLNLGPVTFSADFARGWPSVDESTARISIINGQYSFVVGPFDGRFFNTTAVDAEDFYVQVDTQIEECSEGGVYGLLFRQRDEGNYYGFILFCNNTYSLTARVNGSLIASPLASGSLPTPDVTGTHRLGVLAQGDTLILYFDEQQLATISDQRHSQGDVALYAASQSTNVMQVAFDNLKVWSLR